MPENANNNEAKQTSQPIDMNKFRQISAEYLSAPSAEARAKLVADNKDLVKQGILLSRRLEREALPMYAGLLHRVQENSIYDKARAVKDATLLGVAGVALYKGGKWVWEYFHTT